MRKTDILFMGILTAFITSCCKDKEPVTEAPQKHILVVDNKSFDLSGDEGEYSFFITTEDPFIVLSDRKWIKLKNLSEQKQGYMQSFIVERNNGEDTREGVISIVTNYDTVDVSVKQGDYPLLRVISNEAVVSDDKNEIEVRLAKPIDVTFDVKEKWISFKKKESNTLYIFSVQSNSTYDKREAYIYISAKIGNQKDSVKVIQLQKDALIMSSKDTVLNKEGGIVNVRLKSNNDIGYNISNPEWINEVEPLGTRAMVDSYYSYKVLENNSRYDRTGKIFFYNSYYTLSETFNIKQTGIESLLKIRFAGSIFDNLVFYGTSVYGEIDWGDAITDDNLDYIIHQYGSSSERQITVKSHNANGITFDNIVGIKEIDLSQF